VRAPVDRVKVTPRGAFNFDRGGGVIHHGVDLGGPQGTPVFAPEEIEVLYAGDGSAPPLTGYHPGAIIARGASGVFWVLGHLDPAGWIGGDPVPGRRYAEGEQIGTISNLNHVHVEVRDTPTPTKADRAAHVRDPLEWIATHAGGGGGFLDDLRANLPDPPALPAPAPSAADGSWLIVILIGLVLMEGSR